MSNLHIGIMNVAHLHADSYVGNLRAVPGVEMIGIADEDDIQRGQDFAAKFDTKLYADYAALLADADAVVVCSENTRHRPLVEMAAAAGVHVLCEKPLATTAEDAQAMIDACAQAGVTLMTAFPMRFSAPLVEVKFALDQGAVGALRAFNTTNQGQNPSHHRAWFVDKALAGGGAGMDHIVHLADILRWILGSEITEVYAQFNRIMHADEVEVETGGLIMLTFANGIFASIDCSWSRPRLFPTWGGMTMEIVGDDGVILTDPFRQNLTVHGNPARHMAWAYWGSDPNQAMIDEFVAAVRAGRPPAVTGLDGLRATEIVLAAYRSAELGVPVAIA
ncbi:MAG: Gfo/Idh/MocA family oxidoreductase [Caldilineaceae bacterium]|nr:Gfo/Idh/MocA family oxidoreductase [Caldilineaceae bacterium]MBP8108511.1 Gfo/Idh/MocA family oxidoreductase [Caldilineaceae bacterium]MBP8123317.1 Gfo/Idh/MocA family oxidoreductase [Caldilineaceae bacterium]MBP9074322.1 Gfo/Idh/MocA family oxidoreductase [Caldilineaceae bacterium]